MEARVNKVRMFLSNMSKLTTDKNSTTGIVQSSKHSPKDLQTTKTSITQKFSSDAETLVINKTFLRNTIGNVENHNRKEEMEDSWRQNDLIKRSKRPLPMNSSTSDEQEEAQRLEREKWALKKLRTRETDERQTGSSVVQSIPLHTKDDKKSKDKDKKKKTKRKEKKSSRKE